MNELYDHLGLKPDATTEQVKAAHRRRVKRCHPDKGGDRKEFERVQLAYEVLSDPTRRKRYDEDGWVREQTPEELLRRDAVAMAVDLFAGLAGQFDPTDDLLEKALEATAAQAEAVRSRRKVAERTAGRIKQVADRLKYRRFPHGPDEPDLVTEQLRGKADGCLKEVAALDRMLDVLDEMVTLLADYKYRSDPPKPAGFSFTAGQQVQSEVEKILLSIIQSD